MFKKVFGGVLLTTVILIGSVTAYAKQVTCPQCGGKCGCWEGKIWYPCDKCGGTGYIDDGTVDAVQHKLQI